MRFVTPAALWLLALALLPLLARRKRPVRRLAVATIHLWAEAAAREAAPLARRLRRHWLAAVQVAIAAAVAVAIARPLWPSSTPSAAIIVDTSLSMSARSNGTTRLALAGRRAGEWAERLPPGTPITLIAASPTPRTVGTYSAGSGTLNRALAALRTTDAGAPLDSAAAFARSLSPAPARTLIVTDARPPDGGGTEWISLGEAADNLAVVALRARRAHATALDADVLAHVWNFGARPAAATVTLAQDGRVLVRRPLMLAARSGASVATTVRATSAVIAAAIDADDAVPGDNTRATLVAAPFAVRVAMIGHDDFVERALRSRRGVELLPPEDLARADVVACAGCTDAAAVKAPAGAGVLIIFPSAAAGTAPPAPLAVLDATAGLRPPPALEGIDAVATPGPEAPASTVIARAGGRPVILTREANGRRVVELRLDLPRSALVLTPAFPILVADAIDWLSGRDLRTATFDAGATATLALPAGVSDPQVIGPGGAPIAATALADRHIIVGDTASAGIYHLRRGSFDAPFVVTPVTEGESDVGAAAAATVTAAAVPARVEAGRTDVSPFVLLAAMILLAIEWRMRPGRWRSARGAAAVLLVLALVAPRVPWGETPRAIVFALDASDSMAARRTAALAALRTATAAMRAGDRAGLVVFGADSAVERPLDGMPLGGVAPAARVSGSATNIERGLQAARAALPGDGTGRIVLISDGRETSGRAEAEALAARAAGVPIDVLTARSGREVRPTTVTRLGAPPTVHQGETFDVTATVEGAAGVSATVLFDDGGPMPVRRPITLPAAGPATATLTVRAAHPGVAIYRASIEAPEALADFADEGAGAVVAIAGEPRLLNVSDSGTPAIAPAGYRVETAVPESLPRTAAALAAFDAIVLDDVDAGRLDPAQRRALAQHVERGAGLFVLGSARSLTPLDDADPLEDLLPIDLRPRRGQRAPGLALVVVFDKSGSMDDRIDGAPKIEFARQAAARVLSSLPPTDAVGVIAFDSTALDVAPLQPGQDAAALDARLSAVRPSGATALAPALERATAWLRAPGASSYPRKLVLLVSDGRTSPADQARARALVTPGIELSTVALGDDADRRFLSELAGAAGGRAFYPSRLSELPALAAREAVRVSGGHVVEERFTPQPLSHPMLTGLDPATMPPLGGYVVGAPKAGTELALRSPLGDPILAVRRHGLGKVAVYTADLHSTWSAAFRASATGGSVLAQTVRWVSRRVDHPFLHTETVERNGQLHVTIDARGADGEFLNGLALRADARTPAGTSTELTWAASGPGTYEAVLPLGEPGPYLLAIAARTSDGTIDARQQRGFYWTAPRERAGEADVAALATVARVSGGRELAPGDDPFGGPRARGGRQLRQPLAGAALFLFLADVLGIAGIGRRRPRPAAVGEALRKDAA